MSKMVSDSNLQEFGTQFKSKLATVATSGNYNDLSNKPSIPSVSGKEDTSNKVQAISSSTTNYPSCNAVKTAVETIKNGNTIYAATVEGSDSGTSYAFPDETTTSTADEVIATQSYVDNAIDDINSEEWTFELENGTTITKTVLLG